VQGVNGARRGARASRARVLAAGRKRRRGKEKGEKKRRERKRKEEKEKEKKEKEGKENRKGKEIRKN
jgi:hypothetical protein